MRKLWQKMRAIPEKIGKLYPPGYDYKAEMRGRGALFALGIGMNFQFFIRLHYAYRALFIWSRYTELGETRPQYRLREGAVAESFVSLTEDYFWWYLPWLIYIVAAIVLHYLHYYRETKSIYVMRRLKNPFAVIKSCVSGPLIYLGIGVLMIVFGYFLYYGAYLLVMPMECNPGFW